MYRKLSPFSRVPANAYKGIFFTLLTQKPKHICKFNRTVLNIKNNPAGYSLIYKIIRL